MAILSKYVLPLFFLIIFLGTMILGPLIYGAMTYIHPVPFHRAMDRALLVSAIAALGLFWPRITLRAYWAWNDAALKNLLLGYLAALVSAQAMIGLYAACSGFTSADLTSSQIFSRILIALLAAILAPLLEETIFRGFLQTELVRLIGPCAGCLIGAFIFMLAHFLKIPGDLDSQPVHPWSGITALGAAFVPLLHGDFLNAKGLNLFLLGLLLGALFLQTGTLWLSASLHSGWVFILLLFTGITKPVEPPAIAWLGSDLVSSPLVAMVLILLGAWLWRFYHPPPDDSATGPKPS